MKKRKYSALLPDQDYSVNVFTDTEENSLINEDDTPITLVDNIVGTAEIVCSIRPIDLQFVAACMPNSHYDRKRFAAITLRVCSPMCTALLFTSGKLVLTGTTTRSECLMAALELVRLLRQYMRGLDFFVNGVSIQNVVAHVELGIPTGGKLDIARMYSQHCEFCTYQSSMFPGLSYRPDNSPVVLLCFFSGRIVITGGRCERDIKEGWRKLWPVIRQYIQ
jgi:transcription initiation factor TFIID TATA-box-binding protein